MRKLGILENFGLDNTATYSKNISLDSCSSIFRSNKSSEIILEGAPEESKADTITFYQLLLFASLTDLISSSIWLCVISDSPVSFEIDWHFKSDSLAITFFTFSKSSSNLKLEAPKPYLTKSLSVKFKITVFIIPYFAPKVTHLRTSFLWVC